MRVTLAPPKPSSVLIPGYRLDRYELLCPIAQGGMAAVWVGRQTGKHGFEKLVAIKTILPQFASDHRFQTMFLDEAHIASNIEHPNVAQILDLGEEHDVLYIVMEYVDGDALSKLHRATQKRNVPIPHGVLLRMMSDALGGLHAAHELHDKEGNILNVVHRDVSPQNILVSVKGIAKVIDFGIAKARDRVGGDTGTGVLKGKIHYMPPEQAVGKKVDRRADVWAVGAILYHILSNRVPYEAENSLATLHMLTSGRPPLPLPLTVPKAITAIVRKAMAHDINGRFATAAEMQAAIEAAMVELSIRTSTADVAAFLALHVSDRQAQRKQATDLALKAAAERLRMQQLLKPSVDSSSGLTGLSPVFPPSSSLPDFGSNPGGSNPGGLPGSNPGALPGSNPGGPASGSIFGPEVSQPSMATLGSAAIETFVGGGVATPAPPSRRRAMVFGGVGLAAAAAIAIILVFAIRGGNTPSGAANDATEKKTSAKSDEATEPATTTAAVTPTATATAMATATASAEPTATATASAPPPVPVTATATAVKPLPTATAKSKPTTSATTPPKPKPQNDGF